jgi:hypothetical protein
MLPGVGARLPAKNIAAPVGARLPAKNLTAAEDVPAIADGNTAMRQKRRDFVGFGAVVAAGRVIH